MKYQKLSIKTLHKSKCLCYNGIMLKTKTKVKISLAGLMLAVSAFLFTFPQANSSAEACTTSPCNTTFQVNVKEFLSVEITNDHVTEATGDPGEFLRNKIDVTVNTNNSSGFVAFMHSLNNTNLTNAVSSTVTMPTLSGDTSRSSFTANRWGYNLTKTTAGAAASNADTASGNDDSIYSPMSTSNIGLIVASAGTTSGDQSIYFGTKADNTQASGTYLGTVVINVISGTSEIPNSDPSDPATPSDDTPNDSAATYDSSANPARTVYTTSSTTGGVTTTTTQVSAGDNTTLYESALGETRRTESNVNDGSGTATGLAIAASTAAAGGMIFFILAKRREDDEEDEEELQ